MGANRQFLNLITMKLFSLACLAGAFKQLQLDIAKCEAMENPSDVEEFKCITGVFKNFYGNADKCIHPSADLAVGDGPGACIVKVMKQVEQDMAKCDQLEDVEEFKCVTSTFKNFFVGAAQCIAGMGREGEMKCELNCMKDLDEGMLDCTGNDNEVAKCELGLMREWFSCSMR